MNYYNKLFLSVILFVICYIILYFISKPSNNVILEKMSNYSCNVPHSNLGFGTYSFDKYYGRNSLPDARYKYAVHFDKNYKNFSDNRINYNDFYDAYYKNTETKDNRYVM